MAATYVLDMFIFWKVELSAVEGSAMRNDREQ